MTVPSPEILQASLILALAPYTRTLVVGQQPAVQVNSTGVDVYVNDVPPVLMDEDNLAHPYLVLWTGGGTLQHTRLAVGASVNAWGFQVTCAGGDPERALWALSRARKLDGQYLAGEDGKLLTGPITETVTGQYLAEDTDANPPRWFIPLLYACSAH